MTPLLLEQERSSRPLVYFFINVIGSGGVIFSNIVVIIASPLPFTPMLPIEETSKSSLLMTSLSESEDALLSLQRNVRHVGVFLK